MKLYVGVKSSDQNIEKFIRIPKNKSTTPNRNYLMIATQGSGKTNLLMLLAKRLYDIYIETEAKFGAIPIIFAPTYEFMQMETASKNTNLPPNTLPEGQSCVHITFPVCEPIRNEKLQICSFDFKELDHQGILGFTDLSDEDKYLGAIKKLILRIREGYEAGKGKDSYIEPPKEFNLDNFIYEVKKDSALKDALYHVFTDLRDEGMFDNDRFPKLDLKAAIMQKKPIVFHFGSLDDRQRMSGIAGILLKQLWDISGIYYNAMLRKQDGQSLDEFEDFLLKNWTVALIMEEAHQILYATKSGGMTLESKHPAHYWFKKITALMGRKRMFKYSAIVTQKFMEIFYGIRTTFDELILGSTIYPDDKVFLETDLKIRPDHVNKMTKLSRFAWCFVDIDKYQKRRKRCASKIKVYLSPCGQPK